MIKRFVAFAVALSGVGSAFGVLIHSESLGPGVWGNGTLAGTSALSSSSWSVLESGGATYNYYAGIMKWTRLDTNTPFSSVCADMQGSFSVGQSFEVVPINPITAPSQLVTAANIFGSFYVQASSDAVKGSALQLAVWQALGNQVTISNHSSDLFSAYTTYLTTYTLGQSSKVTYLQPTSGGQGQFVYASHYTPADAVPEPFTMALGVGSLGLAFLRRRRSK